MKTSKYLSFNLAVGLALGIAALSIPIPSPSLQAAEIHYIPPVKVTQVTTPAPQTTSPPVQASKIHYVPPVKTAPVRRVGAGTRGTCPAHPHLPDGFAVRLIAPDTTGETLSAQPTLYWSVSKPITGQFSFSVEPVPTGYPLKATTPLFETTLSLSVKPGIQTIPLANYKVNLAQNVEYTWSVALVCDVDNPSTNQSDSGTIKYVAPAIDWSDHLQKVSKTDQSQLPYIYAENGLWYDAVKTLVEQIRSHPQDKTLHQTWKSLLKQGGLSEEIGLP